MAKIRYITGDATQPVGDGNKVIVHCANTRGQWGSGFVLALSKRWSKPEMHYRSMTDYKLGTVGVVPVEDNIYVANLIGQDGIAGDSALPPIRYEAIRKGFRLLAKWTPTVMDPATLTYPTQFSIHMPRLGCWLAGGDWALIEPLVKATFLRASVNVTVYDFPGGSFYNSRDPDSVPFRRKGKAP